MGKDLEDTFLNALEEHQHKLLRICSVYAKDEDDTKDLFQEVLVNIWKSMPSFKGKSNIGTWMYRITLNVCLRLKTKEVRKQKKLLRMDSRAINIHKRMPRPMNKKSNKNSSFNCENASNNSMRPIKRSSHCI